MAGTAARCRQDTRTATASGCWGKPGLGLGGTRARPDPGDSSGFWRGANVGELAAVSVAGVRFECAGFGVRIGLDAESANRVVLGNGSGTRVRFEGTGSGAWVRFVGTGSVASVRFVGIGSEAWVKSVSSGTEV